MNELWVAVDDDGWCCIAATQDSPKMNKKTGMYAISGKTWSMGYSFAEAFNLRPGECKRLVMAEETSE